MDEEQLEHRDSLAHMFWAIVGIFLGIFLLFFSFFVHYINEVSTDTSHIVKVENKKSFFDGVVFWDVWRAATNYKREFLRDVNGGHTITNWIFRGLATFFMWLWLTLIFTPIFTKYARDTLAMYALYTALWLSIIFAFWLHAYMFIMDGGLSFLGDIWNWVLWFFGTILAWFQSFLNSLFGINLGEILPFWLWNNIFSLLFLVIPFIAFLYWYIEKNREADSEKRVWAFKVYKSNKED